MRGLWRTLTWALVVLGTVGAGAALGAAGDRDRDFAIDGFAVKDLPGNNEFFEDLVILESGKILAAGGSGGPPAPAGFTLERLLRGGSPDGAYGVGGVQVQPDTGVAGGPRSLSAIEIQPDGKIAAAGLARGTGGSDSFGFARYLPDGTPDTSFGDNGIRVVQPTMFGDALDVAPTPDGGMIAVGSQGSGQVAIVKLTAAGDPDTAFGPGGIRSLDLPGTGEFGSAVRVPDNGTILIGGSTDQGAFLAKLDGSGNPVPGFGSGGIAIFNFGANPLDPVGEIFDLRLLPGGGVVAVGDSFIASQDREAVVLKTNPNGSANVNFGASGLVRLNPTNRGDSAFALSLVENRILVAGTRAKADDDTTERVWLFRLLANGRLDGTFGAGGQKVHAPSPKDGSAFGLALQPDGRPVIAGTVIPDGENFSQLLVGRFQADPTCFGRLPTVRGTGRRDVLRGTRGRDVIVGLGGADVIRSFAGRDLLCSGAGPDRNFGGGGRDRINAGGGGDLCNGGAGRDQLRGCERRR